MEALYRKYRPSTFADVVGQEHIERTLKNAIEQGKVSHAYLFCGPRGTGKTTMARILAKALLCEHGPTVEPDGTCAECEAIAQGTHPDVYELDAASRTGVENVREEIISRVSYAPTRGAWKVYIIDEVHMLSTAAFNALLKTLEEPPGHVVFILCTTDPQKVPETIHSRCQRFDFHRISAESIVSRLGAVCVEEGVDFEGEALDLIAYRAEGGMRNALTSLEQLIAFGGGHVTLQGAQNLLGSLDDTDLSEIVLAIGKRDAAACFNWIARYVETGADLAQFVRDLAEHIRNMYLLSMAGLEVEIPVSEATRNAMVDQLKLFGQDRLSRLLLVLGDLSKELRASSNPRLSFEIALTRMIRPESDLTLEALAERIEALEQQLAGQGGAPIATPGAAPAPAPAVQSAPAAPAAQSVTASAAPAPATAPAAQASQPALAAAPDPAPAPAAAPAPAVAATPAPANVPAADAAPAAMTAQVDISNPAALQRLWHSVTSTLRKANPARGVLFMNAKVSVEADGSGIVVEFGKDNAFAYNAAQKKEVRDLLTQTIASVAGGSVPYRLALASGGAAPASAAAPAAPKPAAAPAPQAAPAPVPQPAAPAPAPKPAAPAAVATSAPAAAAPAAAPEPTAAPKPAAPKTQAPASDAFAEATTEKPAIPQFEESAPTPAASGSATWPTQAQSPAPVAPTSAASTPVPTPQPSAPAPDDDRVPLDVYDAAPFGYEEPQSEAPAPSAQPASAKPATPTPAAAAAAPAVAATTAPAAADEASQIVDILTGSFGEGVKFEELPE